MAILAIFSGPDIKTAEYEKLRRLVDWEHDVPEGMLFHSAAFDERGSLRVSDVWTSREALDRFFDTRLLPAMKKLELAAPVAEVFPLHTAFAAEEVEQFRPVSRPDEETIRREEDAAGEGFGIQGPPA